VDVFSAHSVPVYAVCIVPVYGPVLCYAFITPITADLISVIESHGLSPHVYADDAQVHGCCRPAAVDALSSRISECVGAVASWMQSNRLDCDKTEVV